MSISELSFYLWVRASNGHLLSSLITLWILSNIKDILFSAEDQKGRFNLTGKGTKITDLAEKQMWVNWQEYLQLGNWRTTSSCEETEVADEFAKRVTEEKGDL